MFEIEAIPTLETNYVWMFTGSGHRAYIVDPGEAQPVLERLQQNQTELAGILITHHHWDHTDGLGEILAHTPVPVYGPSSVPEVSNPLEDGDPLVLDEITFTVMAVPGHTLDHIAYFAPAKTTQAPVLFCGDALFAGGCGRLFEGTPEQALHSLKKLTRLPAETQVYCAHEYTLANLRFARQVEPGNAALAQRLARDEQRLASTGTTLPTTMVEELATNPFLRCTQASVKSQVEAHCGGTLTSETEVFAALRRWKDVS